jgi:uncharacterized RDD family membrane protein YckC
MEMSVDGQVTAVQFAGFWRRFAAGVIDWSIVVVGFLLIMVLTVGEKDLNDMTPVMGFLVKDLLLPVLGIIYYASMESSRLQATIGKCLLGIRVVHIEGGKISLARALGRAICKSCSYMLFGLGFFIIPWMKKKQGLHDLMSGCVMVCKPTQDQMSELKA